MRSRLWLLPPRGCRAPFSFKEKPDIGTCREGTLQGNPKIDDLNLVIDKRALYLAVLAAPRDRGGHKIATLVQEPRSPIGQGVEHRRGARGRKAIELGTRTVDIAGVEEP